MSIVVTGATGHLGRLIVESLLRRGVPADQIVALGRDVAKAADLAERGVVVKPADYNDVDSLRAAFAGADKLMFVSGSEAGQRVPQHRNVVTAAKDAGVGLVVYTSIANADTSSLMLAVEHKATEQEIIASGLPYVFLRNSWYIENYTPQLPTYLEHGIVGAAGDGKVSAATRADYAEAAAAVLTGEGHTNKVYELGGAPFTMAELATEVSKQSGKQVTYTDLPVEKYTEVLISVGLPEPFAAVLADGDRGLAQGELYVEGNDLEKLIGRAPTSLADTIRTAL
ncbi:SDR family oxidoreductase [Planosporangium flavigriseum]|uniref:NAD(P)-dependent oxidoreductase n=1 Tax=Planosporangium flavigriseum TaxID=373681 RepID=A0A8J3LFI0_9ACTN|nr:SDR family oxidoreductase [Planosporangium flavigriseum]NJC63709.1 SDR family oxidoreductase [Planosporangium flavigriseum]GIG72413.1 NAD(P)-dependent oxidoreductase [Planosporangium flavigriseum]